MQQCHGVGTAFLHGHIPDDLFITGRLNIPAQQNVGHPQQRVEPVDAQKGKAQRLPPVVTPADVGLLMGDHIGNVPRLHAGRKVNHRAEQPQHKGGIHKLTALDILPHGDGGGHPAMQQQIADERIRQHQPHSQPPHPGQHKEPDLLRVGTVGVQVLFQNHISTGIQNFPSGRGGGAFFQNHASHGIQNLPTGLPFRWSREHNLLLQRLSAGNQAQAAFHGEGTEQSQRHHSPQQAQHPFGCPAEHQPHSHYRQHQPAGGDAHIHQLYK